MTDYTHSKITIKQNEFVVPMWILDDVEYHYPEVSKNIVSKSKNGASFGIIYYDQFVQLRKQIYWLCHWYDELVNADIPVIDAELLCIHNDPVKMKDVLKNKLKTEKFIRFCNASPKDIVEPIFSKDGVDGIIDDIIDVFKNSNRTNYMFELDVVKHDTHLVLRPVVKIDHEVRCIWHNYKLRAVSGPTYYVDEDIQQLIKHKINLFFKSYGADIMYNSAVIDIGIENDNIFIIEFNSFGSDMLARIAEFDWEDDFMVLYNSKEPVYRFHKEFEW
jgi:hypothetical protein